MKGVIWLSKPERVGINALYADDELVAHISFISDLAKLTTESGNIYLIDMSKLDEVANVYRTGDREPVRAEVYLHTLETHYTYIWHIWLPNERPIQIAVVARHYYEAEQRALALPEVQEHPKRDQIRAEVEHGVPSFLSLLRSQIAYQNAWFNQEEE